MEVELNVRITDVQEGLTLSATITPLYENIFVTQPDAVVIQTETHALV